MCITSIFRCDTCITVDIRHYRCYNRLFNKDKEVCKPKQFSSQGIIYYKCFDCTRKTKNELLMQISRNIIHYRCKLPELALNTYGSNAYSYFYQPYFEIN